MIYILFSPFLYLRNNYKKKKSFHHLLIIKNKKKVFLSFNEFFLSQKVALTTNHHKTINTYTFSLSLIKGIFYQ